MKLILALSAAAALAATAAGGAADAQARRAPTITLYDLPNFQGPSRSFSAGVDNLADQGYNDRAQSARVTGVWRLCEDARMRGRCVEVSGDVPNLGDLRMSVQVSSFEPIGDRGGGYPAGGGNDRGPGYDRGPGFDRGPGPDGRYDRGPYPGGGPNPGPLPPPPPPAGGRYTGPSLDGRTASFFPRPEPGPYRDANGFCRRLGFSGAIYADDRGRELRDVLCRR